MESGEFDLDDKRGSFTYADRLKIEQSLREGASVKQIADRLNRNYRSINTEIYRI